ncbi:MAG: hypothetical protein ABI333_08455 [bacterium]
MTPVDTSPHAQPPPPVVRMVDEARSYIRKALDFDVDGTHDTLPAVDHYLSEVPQNKPAVCALVASAVGCYFGELVRERFGGRWIADGDDPAQWRLQLTCCSLHFRPVGMAYQAITRGELEELFDDGVYVDGEDKPGLTQALDSAAPVTLEVYYTLCNRFDTLEYIVELLMARRAAAEEQDDAIR